MNIVIIEDEDLAAESLEKLLLKSSRNVVVVKRLESVSEALEWFKDYTCDLIFSDIHLGDGESFEIFEALDIKIPIVFTTAFDKYAIQSFQFFAIDYLLKPYDEDKLNSAIEKYFSINVSTPVEFDKIESFLQQLKSNEKNTNIQERFLVSRGEQLISINSNEIAYFMAQDKYLFLFTNTGDSFLYEDTISNIEFKLSSKDFFKINRKFIVSHHAIKQIFKYSQNRLKLELQPVPNFSELILVSSKSTKDFKNWLNN
ncbi:LytR/AlgR family response regulator transcription factor [Flavobacterium aquicola]|uniref:LytTR family two component transcriptional regulator n=1 Tax=Flavobacterium aquicola TaxID=1682742 RepID=A0A3E0EUB6_9FLAO|nr:LytTR family DNA-binding domain-containing protein [Flavobacterium aquicola]REH01756.1 LytTR family two component transcriptional regulator [Flavobacterium aquicola]